MIYIRTCAYNAEKTLRRAIESVLNQTYQDFKYYILDNGSGDRTGEIIREYAARDSRIVPYFSKKNRDFSENLDFWNLSRKIPEGDYYCTLDADDFYINTFFEEMLRFVRENQLEIAACGTVFRDEGTGCILDKKVPSYSMIIDTPEKWSVCFPAIHWHMRQAWGKLYTAKAVRNRYETELPEWWPEYGGDTINALQSAAAVENFGIYAKVLHNYSVSAKSTSYRWTDGRSESDLLLHKKTVEFLEQKCGEVSEENRLFLYEVYWFAIRDTLSVLVRSSASIEKQLSVMQSIVSRDVTKQMLAPGAIEEKKRRDFQRAIIAWLKEYVEKSPIVHVEKVADIFAQFNPDFSKLIIDDQLLWYWKKVPQAVDAIVLCEYEAALGFMTEFLEREKKATLFAVELAQTLSALLQNQEMYILCEKMLIEKLIEQGDLQRAESELTEWEQILPEDDILLSLRKSLEQRKEKNR